MNINTIKNQAETPGNKKTLEETQKNNEMEYQKLIMKIKIKVNNNINLK